MVWSVSSMTWVSSGKQSHRYRAEGGDKASGDKDDLCVHACHAQNGRIDKDDIDHGKKCGNASDEFGFGGGMVCG